MPNDQQLKSMSSVELQELLASHEKALTTWSSVEGPEAAQKVLSIKSHIQDTQRFLAIAEKRERLAKTTLQPPLPELPDLIDDLRRLMKQRDYEAFQVQKGLGDQTKVDTLDLKIKETKKTIATAQSHTSKLQGGK